jgi:peroxiredoxin
MDMSARPAARFVSRVKIARGLRAAMFGASLATACARPPLVETTLPPKSLVGTDGAPHPIAPEGDQRLLVLFFFSAHCPCQAAHDPRLRALHATYRTRGVDFVAVDSEQGATLERDRDEAEKRGYTFPILLDPGGALAQKVGAAYATEVVIVDRSGTVRYHGGIDSDRTHLEDDATPYLRDALEDLLAGRAPRRAMSKALGCALQTS